MVVSIVIAVVGLSLRLYLFGLNRSLWLDEAMLSLNLAGRTFGELLAPLDFKQAAPIGFLLLERASIISLGVHEYTLRLVPLFCSISALGIFWYLVRRCVCTLAAGLGLLLLSLSPLSISYAAEVKPYALDALVGMILVSAALGICTSGRSGRPAGRLSWAALGVAGALSVWLSYTSIFFLGPIWLLLAYRQFAQQRAADPDLPAFQAPFRFRERPAAAGVVTSRRFVALTLLWTANGLLWYQFSVRILSHSILRRFWAAGFPESWSDAGWLGRSFLETLEVACLRPDTPENLRILVFLAGSVLLFAGGTLFYRRDRGLFFLVVGPFLCVMLAAVFRLYPFSGRLLLFLVPMTFLLIAAGVDGLLSRGRVAKAVGILAYALVAASQVAVTNDFLRNPLREEIRPVLEVMSERLRDGDSVYVHSGAVHAFSFYTTYRRECFLPGVAARAGSVLRPGDLASHFSEDLGSFSDRKRLWIVFSHEWSWNGDEQDEILQVLETRGARMDSIEGDGAAAYLYELS